MTKLATFFSHVADSSKLCQRSRLNKALKTIIIMVPRDFLTVVGKSLQSVDYQFYCEEIEYIDQVLLDQ